MQLVNAFDATKVDPAQGSGQFAIGKHPVRAVASDIKPTKDNSGGMLVFDLEVLDGPQKGFVGAYRLNLYNNSAQAAEIAHKQLSALCHVTGVYQVQDSSQLHNIPFIIEVGPQKDVQYTEIKRVFDINGNEPGKAPAPQTAAQPQQSAQNQPQTTQPAWGGGQPAQQQQPAATGAQWGKPAAQGGQPAGNQQPAWGGGNQQANPQNAGGWAPSGNASASTPPPWTQPR